jgi:alpha-L-rhamnosidase
MKAWVEHVKSCLNENDLWQSGHQYGDWLGLDKEIGATGNTGGTDVHLVANAYFIHSIKLIIRASEILGYLDDTMHYKKMYEKILATFQNEYITGAGRILTETQTAAALCLTFDLQRPEHRNRVIERLTITLNKHGNHLTTGFAGTPHLCHALSNNGLHDLAVKVFLQEDYPSWLYAVKMGATTIWERWNSVLPDGEFEASGMNSLNHYAYGAIGQWMFEKVAGLQALEPGHKKFLVAPLPSCGINDIKISLVTPYGKICVDFSCHDNKLKLCVDVPANTRAVICIPGTEKQYDVGSGTHEYLCDTSICLDKQRFSMDNTLGEIWSQPGAEIFLKENMPDMYDNPMIKYVFNKTLAEVASMTPAMTPMIEGLLKAVNES